MHRSLKTVGLLLSFALGAAWQAHAVTISSAVSGGDVNNPITDTDGPATSGEVISEVIIPTDAFSNMTARAAVDVEGNSAVDLFGFYSVAPKPQLAGVPFPQVTDGSTTWTATVTNNSMLPKSYRYRFFLTPIRIALSSYYTAFSDTDPNAPVASYGVEVRANNVLVFESHAVLRGGILGHTLTETGTDLGGVFSFDGKSGDIWYDFPQFEGVLGVGSVFPGGSITVEAKLLAHTEAREYNSGGTASLGDPLDLKGDPGVFAIVFDEAPPTASLLALNDVAQTSGVDQLTRIPVLDTGEAELIGGLGNGFQEAEAMAVLHDPQGADRIFVVDNDRLLELDPATGNGTLIGPIGFPDVDGIAFHPTTGVLYGVTYSSHQLIRIDIATGAGTLVADDFIVSRHCNDIAFDLDGNCFVLTDGTPRIYRVDVTTGAKLQRWTLSGATSLEALSWSPDGTTLFSAADRGSFKDLVWIDLANSTVHFVSDLHSGFGDIEALAWVSPAVDQLLSRWGTPSDAPAPRVATRLHPSVPNPFNPAARLTYDLGVAGVVELTVSDVAGRRIATLASGPRAAGRHHAVWDGRDAAGRPVASGMYIARLRTATHASVQRLVLVR